jgi:hypothetical protein
MLEKPSCWIVVRTCCSAGHDSLFIKIQMYHWKCWIRNCLKQCLVYSLSMYVYAASQCGCFDCLTGGMQ